MRIFLFALLFLSFVSHDYYVSITEIDHNKDSNSLEIGIKVFADDVEKVIEREHGVKLNVGEINEREDSGKYLAPYIQKHFKLKVNGSLRTMEFLGYQMEKRDAVWCFFEIFDVDEIKEILIENTILIDEFDEQKNIIYFGKKEGRPHTMILGKEKTSEVLKFN